MTFVSFLFVLVFAIVHAAVKFVGRISNASRRKLISISGGVAIAYVFSITLPNLSTSQKQIDSQTSTGFLETVNNDAYLVAMAGLLLTYALEKVAHSFHREDSVRDRLRSGNLYFLIPLIFYTLFNVIVGYLLLHGQMGTAKETVFYFAALSVYLLTSDISMRSINHRLFDKFGRWLLVAGVLAGWFFGLVVDLKDEWVSIIYAFISGGIIYQVMQEEIPQHRKSTFRYFAAGCVLYTVLWVAVR